MKLTTLSTLLLTASMGPNVLDKNSVPKTILGDPALASDPSCKQQVEDMRNKITENIDSLAFLGEYFHTLPKDQWVEAQLSWDLYYMKEGCLQYQYQPYQYGLSY